MTQTSGDPSTPSPAPAPVGPSRLWLVVAGLAALVLALALLLFGGRLFGLDSAGDSVLQQVPEFSGTAVGGISEPVEGIEGFVEAGQAAPDFTLQTLDGETVSLAGYKGKPVLLNFWATWCAPCRLEMPELNKTAGDYADTGLVVLGVNQEEPANVVADFVDELGITFPQALDVDGEAGKAYGAYLLPITFFIDPDGVVTAVHRGSLTRDLIDEYLRQTIPPFGS